MFKLYFKLNKLKLWKPNCQVEILTALSHLVSSVIATVTVTSFNFGNHKYIYPLSTLRLKLLAYCFSFNTVCEVGLVIYQSLSLTGHRKKSIVCINECP